MSDSKTHAAREELMTLVLSARSLSQIEQAERELGQWLVDHPNEQGMRDGFEQLSHMRDFAEWLAANPEEAKIVEARRRVRDRIDAVRSLADIPAAQEILRGFLWDYPKEDMSSDAKFLSLLEEAYTIMEQEDHATQEQVKTKTPAHA